MKDLPKPNFIKQIEAITSGNLFGLTGGGEGFIDPPPKIRKTPGPAEKELIVNRWANDRVFMVDKKKRDGTIVPTHISKVTPKGSGYDLLGIVRAEWNQWSKRTGFIHELADKKMTAFVEHLVGKDKYYDIFWQLPNHKRFRKGSRHGPNNVRILKNNRMKSMKDSSETILKRIMPKPTVDNLLVFDYDIKVKPNQSIIPDRAPGNLLLKRVNGTVVGELGDYHDILYAPYPKLKEALGTAINERTGRTYITTKLPDGSPLPMHDIKAQIQMWRTKILEDKIKFIIQEAPTLKGLTKRKKWQYQGSAIQDDMVNFLTEYAEAGLEPAKKLVAKYKGDSAFAQRTRGKTPAERREGMFLNKTQEREIIDWERKKSARSIRDILGPDRDVD